MITAAKDISDEAFLDAIRTVHRVRWESKGVTAETPLGTDNLYWIGASRWDIACVLEGHPEWCGGLEATDGESVTIPEKIVLAKAKRLIRRGLISGCGCGCRGDFQIRPVLPAAAPAPAPVPAP